MLPEWGVVWQTKGFASAMGFPHPLRHNWGFASFYVATILGWANGTGRFLSFPLGSLEMDHYSPVGLCPLGDFLF